MKKSCLTALAGLAISLSFSTISFAATGMKIGVVDVHNILEHSHRLIEMKEQLKKEFSPREEAIIKEQKTLANKMAEYKRNKNVMTQKKLAKSEEAIKVERYHLQKLQMQFQKDLLKAQDKKMTDLLTTFKNKTAGIARKHHLDLVITKSSTIYAAADYDITQAVRTAFE